MVVLNFSIVLTLIQMGIFCLETEQKEKIFPGMLLSTLVIETVFMGAEEPSLHRQKYCLRLIALVKDPNISLKPLLEILRSIFKLMSQRVI